MRSFIAACITAVVIAAVGAMALNAIQKPVETAYKTTGVRI